MGHININLNRLLLRVLFILTIVILSVFLGVFINKNEPESDDYLLHKYDRYIGGVDDTKEKEEKVE